MRLLHSILGETWTPAQNFNAHFTPKDFYTRSEGALALPTECPGTPLSFTHSSSHSLCRTRDAQLDGWGWNHSFGPLELCDFGQFT